MSLANQKIVVALSGGVDSAVAAALLLEAGWQVRGVHLLLAENPADPAALNSLCRFLGIECLQVDLRQEFRAHIIDYFAAAYRQGRTPNPCVRCNEQIKFGLLFEQVRSWGYPYLATGHYARIAVGADGAAALLRGLDPAKEQSYFLHRLRPETLTSLRFPLGSWTKQQVQEKSAALGLTPYLPPRESQELCFIKGSYPDFLRTRQEGGLNRSGSIVNRQGEVLGRHHGLEYYTVGQRRGLGVPASEPYYVLALRPEANQVVVGFKAELESTAIEVEGVNWLIPPPPAARRAEVRIRYRHPGVGCLLELEGAGRVRVWLDQPQKAVAPGQAAVFYDGPRVLGGGWIVRGMMP